VSNDHIIISSFLTSSYSFSSSFAKEFVVSRNEDVGIQAWDFFFTPVYSYHNERNTYKEQTLRAPHQLERTAFSTSSKKQKKNKKTKSVSFQ
jgi:hypothetical protein